MNSDLLIKERVMVQDGAIFAPTSSLGHFLPWFFRYSKAFKGKVQTVHVLGSVGKMISVAATGFCCHCQARTSRDRVCHMGVTAVSLKL